MRYAVYFTWASDGKADSFNCPNAEYRDFNISNMIKSGYYSSIAYCPIYASGEYGKRTIVMDKPFTLTYWLPMQSRLFSAPTVVQTYSREEHERRIKVAERNGYEIVKEAQI